MALNPAGIAADGVDASGLIEKNCAGAVGEPMAVSALFRLVFEMAVGLKVGNLGKLFSKLT